MKKPYLLFFFFLLLISAGCEAPEKKVDLKDLPQNEVELIKRFKNADTKLSSQSNEAGKTEVLDSGRVQISNFVKKDLNLSIQKWPAYVQEVREALMTETIESDIFAVTVFIPLKDSFDEQNPTANAIKLICLVKTGNKPLMDIVKKLRRFNKVLITGTFNAENDGSVNFIEATSIPGPFTFSSPVFTVKLEDIKVL